LPEIRYWNDQGEWPHGGPFLSPLRPLGDKRSKKPTGLAILLLVDKLKISATIQLFREKKGISVMRGTRSGWSTERQDKESRP
jgi:hypothetical protein